MFTTVKFVETFISEKAHHTNTQMDILPLRSLTTE